MDNEKIEIWKDIPNYEGIYQVSNFGNVRRFICNKYKLLKHNINKKGYHSVCLCKNNIKRDFRVNRLVAEVFLPNPNNLPQVNHKDEDKNNNCVDNLEYCTQKYNINYGTGIDRRAKKRLHKICQYSLDNILIKVWDGAICIEKELNIPHQNVIHCCRGNYKTSHGYIWRYYEG